MVVRRRTGLGFIALMLALTLTGCFRQADDSFESVESQSDAVLTPASNDAIAAAASPTVVIIIPESDDADTATVDDATPTLEIISREDDADDADEPDNTPMPQAEPEIETDDNRPSDVPSLTPTIVIISPQQTNTPRPTQTPNLVPTATRIDVEIITPQAPSQLNLEEEAEPEETVEVASGSGDASASNGPTPLPQPETTSPCIYEIESGDTLFGIALRNEVALDDIFEINGLNEDSVLQLGQEILLPLDGCEDEIAEALAERGIERTEEPEPAETDVVEADAPTETAEAAPDDTDEPDTEVLGSTATSGGQTVHRVQPGETLYFIAVRYGVTVSAIVEANELANPNRLSIGQELIIPDN